jgi:hypothetical protein
MLRPAIVAIPLALAIAVPTARADVNRCAQADTDLAWAGTDITELGGDTGWFPSGFVAQLRLQAHVLGHTAVSSGYRAKGCWDEQMEASLAGTPGSGYFDVAYGADLSLTARIHTSILGQSINWEGNIPIPYIPEDLLIAGTKTFDPRLATTTAATVTDTTDAVNVISTDVISQFISLGGISGGLYVSVRGGMTTTYRAKSTMLSGSAVDAITDLVSMARPTSGFHSTLSVPVAVDGVVKYQPKLTFAAGFNVKIFGIQVVNWEIASVPMTLPSIERTLKLSGDPAVLLLPEMDGIGDGARMDFSAASTQSLRVKNLGQGPLEVVPASLPAGVTAAPLTLAAGAEGELRVTIADGALASGSAMLQIQTNDPDRPTASVELGIEVGGTDPGEPPVIGEDDGGCSTGGGQGAGLLVLSLGFVLIRRRR